MINGLNGISGADYIYKAKEGVPGNDPKPIKDPDVYKEKPGQRPEGGFKGGEEVEVEGPNGETKKIIIA